MKDKIYNNAKEFDRKGMNYYVEKELKQSIVNLSISAELIGKAFLATIQPYRALHQVRSTSINNIRETTFWF